MAARTEQLKGVSNPAAKARATACGNPDERFQKALIVQVSKRFAFAPDQRERAEGHRAGPTHAQMRRYLTTAVVVSEGRAACSPAAPATQLPWPPPRLWAAVDGPGATCGKQRHFGRATRIRDT